MTTKAERRERKAGAVDALLDVRIKLNDTRIVLEVMGESLKGRKADRMAGTLDGVKYALGVVDEELGDG